MLCNSKGGRLSRSGGSSDPNNATASGEGPRNAFPSPTTASQYSKLHIAGQGLRSPHQETHHQINYHQHLAGSNVVVCGHIQTTICLVRRLGNPQLCSNSAHRQNVHSDTPTDVRTQDPNVAVLRNGKLSNRGQWRTLGVSPPGLKPEDRIDLNVLIWK